MENEKKTAMYGRSTIPILGKGRDLFAYILADLSAPQQEYVVVGSSLRRDGMSPLARS